MNAKLTRAIRLPSLFLAAALQVLPMARAALPAAQTATNLLAIVFRWAAGAAAALGGVQAVSGASTLIASPLKTNITQGIPWSMRLITSPKQATYWSATGLPSGIGLTGNNGSSLWSIGGTPATVGTYNIGLTAKSSASAGASETTSATLVLTVMASAATAPGIATQPANRTVVQGQNATFSVSATGTAPLTYYWRKATTVISSGTSSSYTITGAQTNHAGNYSVIVSNAAGTLTSSNATLTVNVPPGISVQPGNQTVNTGQIASFAVTATGTSPLTYYWRKGTTVGTVGSSPTYSIPAAQTNDAGSYSVIVSNMAGTITSSNATLTVNVPVIAPDISGQPTNKTVNQNQGVIFSVTATGSAPLTYFWHRGATLLAAGTNATYAIASAQAADAGSYSVIVSNAAGTATSSNATLAVNLLPAITAQPANQNVNEGQSATFNVTATGTGPLTYFWHKGANLVASGASPSFNVPAAQIADVGNYSVIVSNVAGTITSSNAALAVNLPATPPNITGSPADQTVTEGQTATFNVTATGTAPLTYYWRKGTNVFLVNGSPALSLPAVQFADAGAYSVIVSNAAGTMTSSDATLTVNAAPIAPAITQQPTNRIVNQGQSATFTATATGTAPLTYFWHHGAALVATDSTAAFTVVNARETDAGVYSVIVSNAAGQLTSSNATLTVNLPPTITGQPTNRTVLEGQIATFSVTATGTAPLTYYWRKGATVVASGSSASYTISGAQTPDAGNYSVIVSNVVGDLTSSNAILAVTVPPPTSVLTVQIVGNGFVSPDYNGQPLLLGQSYTMTANPGSGSTFAGWSGGTNSALPTLTFVMQPNLVLQAAFTVVSHPTPTLLPGNYQGLFREAAGASRISAGFAQIKVNAGGAFSGWLLLNGARSPFGGAFDDQGSASGVITRKAPQLPVTFALQLDPATEQITGTLGTGTWAAELAARRAAFGPTNPTPHAGIYTFAIPGTPGATDRPAGHGSGTLQVSASGQVLVRAALADGSRFLQLTTLAQDGQFPLFASLYTGRGLILGWMKFEDRAGDDFNGVADWIRAQQPTSARYTFGFQVAAEIVGSKYVTPARGVPVLNLEQGQVVCTDGGLSEPLTNRFSLNTNNVATSLDSPWPSLLLRPTTGQFTGRTPHPAGTGWLNFSGVVLQKRDAGFGCFPAGNLDGAVYLGE